MFVKFYCFLNNVFPSWLTLKKLTDSKLARLTIIVPVVGWLLVYNDNMINILAHYFEIDIFQTLSWKLHAFYLGLVLISLSAIIFIVWCPEEIKKHDDASYFVDFEKNMYTEETDRNMSLSANIEPINWREPPEPFVNIDGSFGFNSVYEANKKEIIDQLKLIFSIKDISNLLIRFICLLSFLSGVVLTILPTALTLNWSINQLIKTFPM